MKPVLTYSTGTQLNRHLRVSNDDRGTLPRDKRSPRCGYDSDGEFAGNVRIITRLTIETTIGYDRFRAQRSSRTRYTFVSWRNVKTRLVTNERRGRPVISRDSPRRGRCNNVFDGRRFPFRRKHSRTLRNPYRVKKKTRVGEDESAACVVYRTVSTFPSYNFR